MSEWSRAKPRLIEMKATTAAPSAPGRQSRGNTPTPKVVTEYRPTVREQSLDKLVAKNQQQFDAANKLRVDKAHASSFYKQGDAKFRAYIDMKLEQQRQQASNAGIGGMLRQAGSMAGPVREAYDRLYQLRAEKKTSVVTPGQPTDVAITNESSAIFNPGGEGSGLVLSNNVLIPTIWPDGSAFLSSASTSANGIQAILFILPGDIEVVTAVIEVTGAVAAQHIGYGIYDEGGTLVFQTGAISAATQGAKRTTLPTPITLTAGMYWSVVTVENVAVSYRSTTITGPAFNNIFNSGTVRSGTAATGGTAGVLDATLPALTSGGTSIFAMLEIS